MLYEYKKANIPSFQKNVFNTRNYRVDVNVNKKKIEIKNKLPDDAMLETSRTCYETYTRGKKPFLGSITIFVLKQYIIFF